MGATRVMKDLRLKAAVTCVALLGGAVWLLAATGAHAGETLTRTFSGGGDAEQSWVVPAGVTTVGVRAVGGRGQNGGAPAEVTGQIAVTPGQTLYVEVGGSAPGRIGGFNGGGNGGDLAAGGGGGATDIRTISRHAPGTLGSRLVVAAGSGGGGSSGLRGGDAGAQGEGEKEAEGGEPGTQTQGGSQAVIFECDGGLTRATDGSEGAGGNGGECHALHSNEHAAGGGGGAGLYGGGGGGLEFIVEEASLGAGGGGGSSLVPEGGAVALAAPGVQPVLELSYPRPESPPVVATGGTSSVSMTGATLHGTVDPEDNAVTSCTFEYGTSVFYEGSAPCASSPGAGDQPVAVSAAIEGLSPSTTYHYRVVATNGEGTTGGADAEFTTAAHGPPTVSDYSPKEGKDGTVITFTGTELEHVTTVKVAGSASTDVKHLSPTSLSATVPTLLPGQFTITLIDDLGNEMSPGKFEVVREPGITKVAPKKGPDERRLDRDDHRQHARESERSAVRLSSRNDPVEVAHDACRDDAGTHRREVRRDGRLTRRAERVVESGDVRVRRARSLERQPVLGTARGREHPHGDRCRLRRGVRHHRVPGGQRRRDERRMRLHHAVHDGGPGGAQGRPRRRSREHRGRQRQEQEVSGGPLQLRMNGVFPRAVQKAARGVVQRPGAPKTRW